MAQKTVKQKKEKPVRMKKIPKSFKKKYKAKYFEKKVVKKLYLPKDQEMVRSLYSKTPDGYYVLKDQLVAKEDADKLNRLGKAVKRNRSFVIDTTKIGAVAVILGAVIAGYLLFRNLVVKWGIEAGLESIFKARATAQGVDFDIVRMRIALSSLQVADESAPMKNLFEFGKTEIKLNPAQVFQGKVVIENVECQNIKWGTDRSVWGGLKPMGSQVKVDGGSDKGTNRPSAGLLPDFSKMNVGEILEANKTNLKSLAEISNANVKIAALTNKWQGTVETSKKNVADAEKNLSAVRKINVGAIKTPDQAKTALDAVSAAYPSVNAVIEDTGRITRDIGADKAAADKLVSGAGGVMDRDYQYLLSALSLPKGGVTAIASSLAGKYLEERFGKLYHYALKAKGYASMLSGGDKKDKKEKKKIPEPDLNKRAGYTVWFPAQSYPNFLLQKLASSVGKRGDNYFFDASLKDVSSDADLWGKPITLFLNQVTGKQELVLNGLSDQRTKANKTLEVGVQANNYPFEITEGLGFLNANSVKGDYRFKTDFSQDRSGGTAGTATLSLANVEMDLVNREDFASQVIYDAVKSAPSVEFQIGYRISPEGAFSMNVKSNIDGFIAKKLGKMFGDMTKKYEKEVKDWLMKQVEPELKKNQALSGAFGKIQDISKGNLADANAYKAELDKKKKEIEDQLRKAAAPVEDKAREQIKNIKLPGF